ncbi:Fimbrial protein precursor [Bremerella volcania]|uniref:Fimbrial protein n=1 Tax=Bremerella volcania TaxID=2527984 RepID=A0A518CAU3_9BACT|nr:DUF1559 domain-containing protein [Bremerella volcania]QDU76320.1 Fimbrial protein precursor [Bremerella volcania]
MLARMGTEKRGFTLVELLVVIAIIGVLIALLLPAVQQAREAARRMQCSNNLKQMALATHNYHDVHLQFPPGHVAESNTPNGWARRGSWMVRILPFIEQKAAYDQSQLPGGGLDNHSAGWAAPLLAWQAVNEARVDGFWCPSSPLPKTYTQPTSSASQSAGAPAEIEVQISDYAANAGCAFKGGTTNTAHSTQFWGWGGRLADNGFLPTFLSKAVSTQPPWYGSKVDFAAVTDGSSNTIAIGEQGNFYQQDKDVRASYVRGGWWNGGSTDAEGSDMANYVCTSYPINAVSVGWMGTSRNENVTYNETAFRSAHPGGAQFALGDGSVKFIAETVDFATYTALMDRADGVPVGEY